MPNTENIVNPSLEIIEVESSDSTSTSIEKMFEEGNDTLSEKSIESKRKNKDDDVVVASVTRTSINTSYTNYSGSCSLRSFYLKNYLCQGNFDWF